MSDTSTDVYSKEYTEYRFAMRRLIALLERRGSDWDEEMDELIASILSYQRSHEPA